MRLASLIVPFLCASTIAHAQMLPVGSFQMDETEVTITQFRAFAKATGFQTKAEKEGGGSIYENGWVKKPGWTWARPFGQPGQGGEPAVHVTYDEAERFCKWAGKRLPMDAIVWESVQALRRLIIRAC